MPSWGQILSEITSLAKSGDTAAFDKVRNKYLAELYSYTKRNTIIYASRWTTGDIPPQFVSITDEDIQGFMETIYGLKGDELDLLLHTGGGSAESTDAIVSYLRQKFKNIRIIIPQAAMSAGTMLACAADKIIMGKQSSIGPIDPQFIFQTTIGMQSIPAQAILDQFKMGKKECIENPDNLKAWIPMFTQYGPALLIQCVNQGDFGKDLVENWLTAYMFKENGAEIPKKIAEYLSDHENFKTHGKHINIDKAKEIGLDIDELEKDNAFQDAVLSAFFMLLCIHYLVQIQLRLLRITKGDVL
jgi:hypothetical protein